MASKQSHAQTAQERVAALVRTKQDQRMARYRQMVAMELPDVLEGMYQAGMDVEASHGLYLWYLITALAQAEKLRDETGAPTRRSFYAGRCVRIASVIRAFQFAGIAAEMPDFGYTYTVREDEEAASTQPPFAANTTTR